MQNSIVVFNDKNSFNLIMHTYCSHDMTKLLMNKP